MTSYKTPGVYIEEISKFPPSVAQVETAIPAFIGYTEKAELKKPDDLIHKPKRITSLLEYETYFGGAFPETGIIVTVNETQVGGVTTNTKIDAGFDTTGPSKYKMFYALQHFFANGGGPCYIISAGKYSTGILQFGDYDKGLDVLEKEDEPTLIVMPEIQGLQTPADYFTLQQKALAQCENLKDRFAVMDLYLHNDIALNDKDEFRTGIGNNNLKYGAVYYPNLNTILDYSYGPESNVKIAHLVNGNPGPEDGKTVADIKTTNNALHAQALAAINALELELPPSPALVGIYASVDETRGVWKAPANVSISAVVEPTEKVSHDEQRDYNVDVVAGKSINVIRTFPGRGILVWGARTLAGNDNEWRYIPVRRFYNMVEESVKNATGQFVFEPNDANTWTKVRAMIENFLILQWRAGALAGATTEQAFYVNVGLNETMTALDILEGRMIVEIGMAVVRPAEFIILKFSHKMQEA